MMPRLRRAISDSQREVLVAATHKGLRLPRQNLPTPLVVRNTFIEAPVALPLSTHFSRLRRAASCPAGGQRGTANCCSMSALDETEDEAVMMAAGAAGVTTAAAAAAPQSSEAHGMPQMQPLELAALRVSSVKHASRRCKPCAFVHTDAGCANGTACPFCHACSPGEKRRRQKAKTQFRKQRRLQQREAGEGKEVTGQLQFATGAVVIEAHQSVTEYQHHISMPAEGASCLC